MQEGIGAFRSMQMDDILSSNCVAADCTEQENALCIVCSGRYLVSPVNVCITMPTVMSSLPF